MTNENWLTRLRPGSDSIVCPSTVWKRPADEGHFVLATAGGFVRDQLSLELLGGDQLPGFPPPPRPPMRKVAKAGPACPVFVPLPAGPLQCPFPGGGWRQRSEAPGVGGF